MHAATADLIGSPSTRSLHSWRRAQFMRRSDCTRVERNRLIRRRQAGNTNREQQQQRHGVSAVQRRLVKDDAYSVDCAPSSQPVSRAAGSSPHQPSNCACGYCHDAGYQLGSMILRCRDAPWSSPSHTTKSAGHSRSNDRDWLANRAHSRPRPSILFQTRTALFAS
jgi:hypothetical protein